MIKYKINKILLGFAISITSLCVLANEHVVKDLESNVLIKNNDLYTMRDNVVAKIEENYVRSKTCIDNCSSLQKIIVNKVQNNIVDFSFIVNVNNTEKINIQTNTNKYESEGLVINKKTYIQLPLSMNDFNIVSITDQNNKMLYSIKKDNNINVLIDEVDTLKSINVIALKNTVSNDIDLISNVVNFESKVNNVKIERTNNVVKLVFKNNESNTIKELKENKITQIEQKENKDIASLLNILKTTDYYLERNIVLDNNNWKIKNILHPTNNNTLNKKLNFTIPLLNSEKIISRDINAIDGKINIELQDGNSLTWESEITTKNKLEELDIKKSNEYLQKINLIVKNNWVVNKTNKNPNTIFNNKANQRGELSWWLWANDDLNISLSAIDYLTGKTNAISDISWVFVENNVTLKAVINSSIGGVYKLKFKDANLKLLNATINGLNQNLLFENNELNITLKPSENKVSVVFENKMENTFMWSPPQIIIDDLPINYAVTVEDNKRWNLFAGGADISPSILLLSVLLTLVFFAIVIVKSKLTDLGLITLTLLLFGISQSGFFISCAVVLWFVIIKWRQKQTIEIISNNLTFKKIGLTFNKVQILFILITLYSISSIVSSVAIGLLYNPEVFIKGIGSDKNTLFWYSQYYQSNQQPWLLSLPIGFYRILMLVWSMWLAFSLLKWFNWTWLAFSNDKFWQEKMQLKNIDIDIAEKSNTDKQIDINLSEKNEDEHIKTQKVDISSIPTISNATVDIDIADKGINEENTKDVIVDIDEAKNEVNLESKNDNVRFPEPDLNKNAEKRPGFIKNLWKKSKLFRISMYLFAIYVFLNMFF